MALVCSIVGLFFVAYQLKQANESQKWGNFNQLNIHYYDLYRELPQELHDSACKEFVSVGDSSKKWIRSYFDLYSEENWLYEEGLIPEEMWTKRIDGGVRVNLLTYPTLVDGYEYWKKVGAFRHPPSFIPMVDKKIMALKDTIDQHRGGCHNRASKDSVTQDGGTKDVPFALRYPKPIAKKPQKKPTKDDK